MSKKLLRQVKELLEEHNSNWKSLADSGDAGFWKAEDMNVYIKTEALVEEIKKALEKK